MPFQQSPAVGHSQNDTRRVSGLGRHSSHDRGGPQVSEKSATLAQHGRVATVPPASRQDAASGFGVGVAVAGAAQVLPFQQVPLGQSQRATSWLADGAQPQAPMPQLDGKSVAPRQHNPLLTVPPLSRHAWASGFEVGVGVADGGVAVLVGVAARRGSSSPQAASSARRQTSGIERGRVIMRLGYPGPGAEEAQK